MRDPRRVWPWAAQHKVEQKHKKQARATHRITIKEQSTRLKGQPRSPEHTTKEHATTRNESVSYTLYRIHVGRPRAYNSRNTQQSVYRIHVLIKTEGARVHSRAGRREVPPPGAPRRPAPSRPLPIRDSQDRMQPARTARQVRDQLSDHGSCATGRPGATWCWPQTCTLQGERS